MKSSVYLNMILTAIAALLCAILIVLLGMIDWNLDLESSAYAQTPQPVGSAVNSGNAQTVEFTPWINPRKFIFWDPAKREIYIYDDDGELEVTWKVGRIGDNLTRLRD